MIKLVLCSLFFLFSSCFGGAQSIEVSGIIYRLLQPGSFPRSVKQEEGVKLELSFSQLLDFSSRLDDFAKQAFLKSNQLITTSRSTFQNLFKEDDGICLCLKEFLDLCIKNDRGSDATGSKYRADLFVCSALLGMRTVEVLLYVNSLLVEKLFETTFTTENQTEALCCLFQKMRDGFEMLKQETLNYDSNFERRYNLDCFVNKKLDYFIPGFSISAVKPEEAEKVGFSIFLPRLDEAHFSQELCNKLKKQFENKELIKGLEKTVLPLMFENGQAFASLRLASVERIKFLIDQADSFLSSLDRRKLCNEEGTLRQDLFNVEQQEFEKLLISEDAIKINEDQMQRYNTEILTFVAVQKKQIEELKTQNEKIKNQLDGLKKREEDHKKILSALEQKHKKELTDMQEKSAKDLESTKKKNEEVLKRENLKNQKLLKDLQAKNALLERELSQKNELIQKQKAQKEALKQKQDRQKQLVEEERKGFFEIAKREYEASALAEKKAFEKELALMREEHQKALQKQSAIFAKELEKAEAAFEEELKVIQSQKLNANEIDDETEYSPFTSFAKRGDGNYKLF